MTGPVEMYVIQGPLLTQVRSVRADIVHTVTLYNMSNPQGKSCHVD